jgi:hypothetical protein
MGMREMDGDRGDIDLNQNIPLIPTHPIISLLFSLAIAGERDGN